MPQPCGFSVYKLVDYESAKSNLRSVCLSFCTIGEIDEKVYIANAYSAMHTKIMYSINSNNVFYYSKNVTRINTLSFIFITYKSRRTDNCYLPLGIDIKTLCNGIGSSHIGFILQIGEVPLFAVYLDSSSFRTAGLYVLISFPSKCLSSSRRFPKTNQSLKCKCFIDYDAHR